MEFYSDWKMPEVERLARAVAKRHGHAPDTLVRETGYLNSRMIPSWWKFQEIALAYIAMRDADKEPHE